MKVIANQSKVSRRKQKKKKIFGQVPYTFSMDQNINLIRMNTRVK